MLSDDFIWNITPNRTTNTAEQNANSIYLNHSLVIRVLWAYEARVPGKPNTTSALLYGRIGSLTPTAFAMSRAAS